MQFYVFIFIILAGILTNYAITISNLKKIRDDGSGYKSFEMVLCAVFFGAPVLLFSLIFSEIRDLEKEQHHLFLISGIVLLILEAALVYLLIYYKVVIF